MQRSVKDVPISIQHSVPTCYVENKEFLIKLVTTFQAQPFETNISIRIKVTFLHSIKPNKIVAEDNGK